MTKPIKVGNQIIGGNTPVKIQTMCDIKTSKIADVIKEIEEVYELGCDIIRVSVKDDDDVLALKTIKQNIKIPLVADIHFDYRLCLKAIDQGVDKVRINPGNIGSEENLEKVAKAIKESGVAVRIGANSGSIEKEFYDKYGRSAIALSESALRNVAILEKYGVENIVVSAKASDVKTTVDAYRYLHEKTDYPLHLGVTEAGSLNMGVIKGSIGIGSLLLDGIGDTIRVSLTAPISEEVIYAKRILRSVGLDNNYVDVVSCPTCGRTAYDMKGLLEKVEKAVSNINKPLKVAVMGCVVNGPGEAKECDIGIAGGDGKCVLFKKGEVYKTVDLENAEQIFLQEINNLLSNK